MHPELMRIVAEGIQKGEVNIDPLSLIATFIVFGVIAIFYGLYFCRFMNYISNLNKLVYHGDE